MIGLLRFVLAVLASPFKSKLRLEAENAVLRHQLISHNHPARDARALAQSRLSLLLVLEVTPAGRATADRHGAARIDPADEHGESALGCATYPRRTAQTRV
jgi:hypothetical protein